MVTSLVIAHVALGSLILFTGRRLFWLFIMIAGFFFAAEVAGELLVEYPRWLVWIAAACAGLVGALLAVVLQRVAFILAGIYGGGYLAMLLVQSLGWPISETAVLIVGGIIGALFAAAAMDWAIIVISALAGAGIIISALGLHAAASLLIGGALAALGMLVQAAHLRRLPDQKTSKTGKN